MVLMLVPWMSFVYNAFVLVDITLLKCLLTMSNTSQSIRNKDFINDFDSTKLMMFCQ